MSVTLVKLDTAFKPSWLVRHDCMTDFGVSIDSDSVGSYQTENWRHLEWPLDLEPGAALNDPLHRASPWADRRRDHVAPGTGGATRCCVRGGRPGRVCLPRLDFAA